MQMHNMANNPLHTSIPSDNEAKCRQSVYSQWIIDKLFAPNDDRLTKNWSIPEKKKRWNEKKAACMFSAVSRKVGSDLLWVVEKVLATRGLGVPVDERIGRELQLQTQRAVIDQSVPLLFVHLLKGKHEHGHISYFYALYVICFCTGIFFLHCHIFCTILNILGPYLIFFCELYVIFFCTI